MDYKDFLSVLDKRLSAYFEDHKDFIHCKIGCSDCCKAGDYPMSQLEFDYIMRGYIDLDEQKKQIVKTNIEHSEKGGMCPFLVNEECSIYPYRPIVCRVHGLAYKTKNIVKIPYCANKDKNYANVYKNNEIIVEPIAENLDTPEILKGIEYGEIRNLFDWLK